jgi:hypothetical protein
MIHDPSSMDDLITRLLFLADFRVWGHTWLHRLSDMRPRGLVKSVVIADKLASNLKSARGGCEGDGENEMIMVRVSED